MLTENPPLARLVDELVAGVDFDRWYEPMETTLQEGGIGGPPLSWPPGQRSRVGMQLALCRRFLNDNPDILNFAHDFLGTVRMVPDAVHLAIEQVFTPLARDLQRLIEETYEAEGEEVPPPVVPASDRVVTLDHNKPEYAEAVNALEKVERVLQEANDYGDPEDKEQRIAEISAGRRLLRVARARIAAIAAVLGTALLWLANHFAGGLIGEVAERAWDAMTTLLGSGWQWPL